MIWDNKRAFHFLFINPHITILREVCIVTRLLQLKLQIQLKQRLPPYKNLIIVMLFLLISFYVYISFIIIPIFQNNNFIHSQKQLHPPSPPIGGAPQCLWGGIRVYFCQYDASGVGVAHIENNGRNQLCGKYILTQNIFYVTSLSRNNCFGRYNYGNK